jgi:hypothetical protein
VQHLHVRLERRNACIRARAVVDRALGRVAARRAHSHPLQPHLDPSARACRGRALWTGPDGHHLRCGFDRSLGLVGLGARSSVGASAAIFGLLGALVYYGRRGGSSAVSSQAWTMAIFMFVFGLIAPGIDNVAHAGGFGGGYLAARLLDPLKPERVTHMLGAVICLALSMLSIVASVMHFFLADSIVATGCR